MRFFLCLLNSLILSFCLGSGVASAANLNSVVPDSTNDMFVHVISSKSNAYIGEAFVVSYDLYTAVTVIDPEVKVEINFRNCSQREYPVNSRQEKKIIGGKLYNVFTLKKYLVIANTKGTLELPVVKFHVKVNASSENDFFGQTKIISRTLSSDFSSVKIKQLPTLPDTNSFSGAIGEFKMKGFYKVSNRNTNLLWFHLTLGGVGNTQSALMAAPRLPAGIEIYNISTKRKDTLSSGGLTTNLDYSFQLVAHYRGRFLVPPLKFVFFDPLQNEYRSYFSLGYKWNVNTGPPLPLLSLRPKPNVDLYICTCLTCASYTPFSFSMINYVLVLIGSLFLVYYYKENYITKLAKSCIKSLKSKSMRNKALKKINNLEVSSLAEDVFIQDLIDILYQILKANNKLKNDDFPISSTLSIKKNLDEENLKKSIMQQVSLIVDYLNARRFGALKSQMYDNREICNYMRVLLNLLHA